MAPQFESVLNIKELANSDATTEVRTVSASSTSPQQIDPITPIPLLMRTCSFYQGLMLRPREDLIEERTE